MSDNIRVLIDIDDPERDDEDDNSDLNNKEKSARYNMMEIIDNLKYIRKSELLLKMFLPEIRQSDHELQKQFCVELLNKIEEIINFKFGKFPKLETQENFNTIYSFIYFITHEFSKYLDKILYDIDPDVILKEKVTPDLIKIFISRKELSSRLDSLGEEQKANNELIYEFLVSCELGIILQVISAHVESNKIELVYIIKSKKGEIKDG